ncbi:Por secretion system C-terminal sorting domain-containing protein [Dyadobacter sp. SG02]|uniref:T9SS type A sorting domain-containing protein n=1 Tax=Dyadobacter sp. SG02 TaxID=1855291 RepID=UPI0008CDC80E|nr:T9SS type A sorting domain-containing protein [Dyadobacter sp. SG02]SEJ55726.1 Por secretion system C-terminal sorting domain-containing protein [Dyadobacter sp. SG02]
MEFLWTNGYVSCSRVFALWLVCLAIACTSLTCAYAQESRELLLPGKPDYESLSGNGKQLYNGLTNNRQYPGETIIVQMRPIAEVLSNNGLKITIPGREGQYDVRVKTIEYSDAENYKIYGTVGESLLSVLLTSRNGMKGGMIQGPERSYEICDLGEDGQLLLGFDNDAGKANFCASGIGAAEKALRQQSDADERARKPGDNAKIEPCNTFIRVLFIHANNVSPVSAANHAYNTIDIFNQTVINSGLPGAALIELAGVAQTTFMKTDHDIHKDVLALSNSVSVQNLCNQNKADLVLLLAWEDHNAAGGVPYPPTYKHPNSNRSYAIVGLTNPNIPVIGAHELSHLFGCNHESEIFGLPYAQGYIFLGFNTLVATGTAPGSKIFYYSNPSKIFAGSPMGDATHNNAKVMNDKASVVKAFRPEPNVLNGWVYGPYSGYEYQVYTYEAIAKCGKPPYTYQWKESTDGINYSGNGTGEFHSVGLYHNGNHQFYLKLKITSSDGQVVENWMQIWVDDDPNGGYRKGQKERDSLQIKSEGAIVRPNPTSGRVEIIFNAEKVGEVEVGLADLNGRVHMRGQVYQCNAGRNVINLDLVEKGLASGVYMITVSGSGPVIRKKVIYQPTSRP